MIDKNQEGVNINIYDCGTSLLIVFSLGDKIILRLRRTPEGVKESIDLLQKVANTNPLFANIFSSCTPTELDGGDF